MATFFVALLLSIFLTPVFMWAVNRMHRYIPFLYEKWYTLGRTYMSIIIYHCAKPVEKTGIFADPFYFGMQEELRETTTIDPLVAIRLNICLQQIIAECFPEYVEDDLCKDVPNLVKQLAKDYRQAQRKIVELQLQLTEKQLTGKSHE